MRTLLLLRHASAASPPGVADVDRPLDDRGTRQAEALGCALADGGGDAIELVLCSAARRARETAAALGLSVPVWEEQELYASDEDALLDRVRRVEEEARRTVGTLLVVAHNPTIQSLAHRLLRDDGSQPGPAAFPPATLATLQAPIDRWGDLDRDLCQLLSLQHPA
jgi:phosphohistidine phosphatase